MDVLWGVLMIVCVSDCHHVWYVFSLVLVPLCRVLFQKVGNGECRIQWEGMTQIPLGIPAPMGETPCIPKTPLQSLLI